MRLLEDNRNPSQKVRASGISVASEARAVLMIDQDKCDGCGECVRACDSVRRSMSYGDGACIKLVALEDDRLCLPLVCQQCQDSPCVLTCPTGALSSDEATFIVRLDRKRCVGCGMCLVSCPFGAIHLEVESKKVSKCDLCEGNPACVKQCKTGALVFASPHMLGKGRRTTAGARTGNVIGGWR